MVDLEKYTLKLDKWQTPATKYPMRCHGQFRISRRRYVRGWYEMYGIDGHLLYEAVKPLMITELQELRGKRWKTWMVDDPPHWRAMEMYAEAAYGNVLVAGLGLGLIVHALAKNKKVKYVCLVEKSADVIKLVYEHTPDAAWSRYSLVTADFWEFVKSHEVTKTEWDWVIVDLWVANGLADKHELFRHEVLPAACDLQDRFKDAKFVFHGFQQVTDVRLTSDDMLKKLKEFHDAMGRP